MRRRTKRRDRARIIGMINPAKHIESIAMKRTRHF
jgi:hypothetical protein